MTADTDCSIEDFMPNLHYLVNMFGPSKIQLGIDTLGIEFQKQYDAFHQCILAARYRMVSARCADYMLKID